VLANKLLTLIESKFGEDWTDIEEPETYEILLKKNGVEPTAEIIDMVHAIKACLVSSSPWENPFVFENIVDALNGNTVTPESITKPEPEEIMLAVSVMKDLVVRNFSDDVARYIACIAIDNGYVYFPEPLDFCNKYIPADYLGLRGNIERLLAKEGNGVLSLYNLPQGPLGIQLAKISALQEVLRRQNGNK